MNIRATLTIITLFLLQISYAQIVNPVKGKWSITPLGKGNYKLVYNAKIDKGWMVYSSATTVRNGIGPVLLDVYVDTTYAQLISKFVEKGKKINYYDPNFVMNAVLYRDSFKVEQTVRVLKNGVLKGRLYFMACTDNTCIPPQEVEFSFDVKAAQGKGIYIEWDTTRSEAEPVHNGRQTYPNTYHYCGIMPFKQTLAIITKRMGLCFLTSYTKLAA